MRGGTVFFRRLGIADWSHWSIEKLSAMFTFWPHSNLVNIPASPGRSQNLWRHQLHDRLRIPDCHWTWIG